MFDKLAFGFIKIMSKLLYYLFYFPL